MPDISRLPELALILEVSVDDIIPNHKQAKIFEKINEGNLSDISKNDDICFADIVQTAPLLKPSQLNDLFNDEDYDLVNIGALCGIAPFVSR